MENKKRRMADKLSHARLIVEGAQKPEPAQALSAYGYPLASLAEGRRYQQAAEQTYIRAIMEHGNFLHARKTLAVALRQAHARYIDYVRLARKIFPIDHVVRQRLSISGRRHDDQAGWLRQAADFYQQALADAAIQQALAAHGANLAAGQAEIDEVLRLMVALNQAEGDALLARRERDEAFARLDRWIQPFIVAARMAFGRSRGLLEQLGL